MFNRMWPVSALQMDGFGKRDSPQFNVILGITASIFNYAILITLDVSVKP